MLTIFSTAKPFRAQAEMAQRNALRSWTLLHPDCEVILFGSEPGARETALDLGIRHVPNVERSEYGSVRLDFLFARAHQMSGNDLLCYANCDIVFLHDFVEAIERVRAFAPLFLMVGRRWNTPVRHPIDFSAADWQKDLREFALHRGQEQGAHAVDYFVFSRGLYESMPPFVVARTHWDHWMLWKARSMRAPVIDASADVLAIHQNHDYAYHSHGLEGVRKDPESRRNRALAGGQLHLYTIDHATHQLVDGCIQDRSGRWHVPVTSLLRVYSSQIWYRFLKATFRTRRVLGVYRRKPSADTSALVRPSGSEAAE